VLSGAILTIITIIILASVRHIISASQLNLRCYVQTLDGSTDTLWIDNAKEWISNSVSKH